MEEVMQSNSMMRQSSSKIHYILIALNLLTFFALVTGGVYIWWAKQADLMMMNQKFQQELMILNLKLDEIQADTQYLKEQSLIEPMPVIMPMAYYEDQEYNYTLQMPKTVDHYAILYTGMHDMILKTIEFYEYSSMHDTHYLVYKLVVMENESWQDDFEFGNEQNPWRYMRLGQNARYTVAYENIYMRDIPSDLMVEVDQIFWLTQ